MQRCGLPAGWPRTPKWSCWPARRATPPASTNTRKACSCFRHCLDTSLNVRHVLVEVHTDGWPQDEKTLDDADTIVIFSDGGSRGHQHPLVAGNHMPALERQMRRGCGLVVIHWGLNLPSKIGNETFLRWIGGFKDYENPPRPIGEPLRVARLVEAGGASDLPRLETVRDARGRVQDAGASAVGQAGLRADPAVSPASRAIRCGPGPGSARTAGAASA